MAVEETQYIVVEPGVLGGKPHIAGHRIAAHDVAAWVAVHGMSPDEVAQTWHLTLGEIYAALSYYCDHQDAIDEEIEAAERRADEGAARQRLFEPPMSPAGQDKSGLPRN